MLGRIKKGEKHEQKSIVNLVLGLLLLRNFSDLALTSHFIQMLAIKSENTLAGASLLAVH